MNNPTIKDVAKAAGVSTATVSRVLNKNGYVSESARKRVIDTIRALNYQPNAFARSLKQDRSRSIGFVLPDLMNAYFIQIARTIQAKLMQQGYHLLMMESEDDAAKEKVALDLLTAKRVEAIILAPTGGNRERIAAIRDAGIPIVLIDRKLDGLVLDSVAEDNIVPAKEGTAYLASRHRRIGLINGPQHVSTAVERRRAVLEQLEAAGSDRPEVYEYEGDYTRESGKQAIRYFMALPEPPTGLFSANNEMTYGVFLGLRELGLPADAVEIVSFGGLEFSSLFNHRMSYIRQSPAAVGESAADLALQCAANPAKERENRILVPRFVQNDEC